MVFSLYGPYIGPADRDRLRTTVYSLQPPCPARLHPNFLPRLRPELVLGLAFPLGIVLPCLVFCYYFDSCYFPLLFLVLYIRFKFSVLSLSWGPPESWNLKSRDITPPFDDLRRRRPIYAHECLRLLALFTKFDSIDWSIGSKFYSAMNHR